MITKKKKLLIGCGLIALFALLALFLLSGENLELLKSILSKKYTGTQLQEKLGELGIRGYITVAILSMLQIIFPFLPAEPVQVLAGLAFGFPIGLLCCMIGVFFGNLFIFTVYKIYGDGVRHYFVKNVRLDFDKLSESARITLIIFILYFLPAIPYGMICFLAASVGMKLPRYLTVTLIGALPSVCIGVGLGHVAIAKSLVFSLIVFAVLLVLLLILTLKRNAIFAKLNAYLDERKAPDTAVKKCSPFIIDTAFVISKIVLFFKRVRVKYTNKLGGDVENPAIVLCNHGSFLDFVFAGTLLRRKRPNFVVARLYFYKTLYARIMRRSGCFPKSMMTSDLESAKNCLRVLKNGDVLAMMPEARLSTVGKFEDIQEGTYSFLKKSGVPIYSIVMHGDYFASPKWGNGFRRGSYIEAELDLLFTPEQLAELSTEQIREAVESRLCYDEFEWIKAHPEQRYRSKTLAQGLENILSICPQCGKKHSITTEGRTVACAACGCSFTLTDRYAFEENPYFENFAAWYAWQTEKIADEIERDPAYALRSKVELKMASTDGKTLLRSAGQGVCTLTRAGLTYEGTKDGEAVTLEFPIQKIYRLLFGAGEDFEVYQGKDIYYFVPEEKRACVDYYIASEILYKAALSTPTEV